LGRKYIMKDHFKDRASEWDQGSLRVRGAKVIADSIMKTISLNYARSLL